MNVQDFCRKFRVDEATALIMGSEWWRSESELPPGGPGFLRPDYLKQYFAYTALPPEVLPKLEEMTARINADPALVLLAWHTHRSLVVYENLRFRDWNRFDELFDGDGGIFYLLIACSIVPHVQERLRALGIPDEYIVSCTRIRGYYDTFMSGYGKSGLNPSQLHWLRHYVDGKVFRVGRFEYMPAKAEQYNAAVFRNRRTGAVMAVPGPREHLFDGDGYVLYPDQNEPAFRGAFSQVGGTVTAIPYNPRGFAENRLVTLRADEWEMVAGADSDVLGLHIPEGGKMTADLCRESFRQAFEFFSKYFPERDFRGIFCASWIFYPYYERVLPDSNLAALMRELYLFPVRSSGNDGVYFIFGRADGDYRDYPRDNSVRRAMLDVLQPGGRLRCGGMFFLADELALFGQQPYRNMKKEIEN
jgi:hypothetical protein